MTREHIWPDWARELVPKEVAERQEHHAFRDGELGLIRSFDQQLFRQRVRDVCFDCNSGWMSRCEEEMKELASGLLVGRRRLLYPSQQLLVARWGLLKALICQRSFPQNDLPIEHYRELYEARDCEALPAAVSVTTARVAWSAGQAPPLFYRLNMIALGGRPSERGDADGYLITFSMLDLVIQVLRLYNDETSQFRHPSDLAAQVRSIWPTSKRFIWPPGAALTNEGLEALSGALDVKNRQDRAA